MTTIRFGSKLVRDLESATPETMVGVSSVSIARAAGISRSTARLITERIIHLIRSGETETIVLARLNPAIESTGADYPEGDYEL